jgi:hypothetical protein
MKTNAVPDMNMSTELTGCCPKFDPKGWDGQVLNFKDKKFVKAETRSVMHMPVNMGKVFSRVQNHIEDAGAQDANSFLVLSREMSSTHAEHLFAVTRDVPDEEMTTLSGSFLTRVFEGPYRKAGDWVHEMKVAAQAAGNTAEDVYLFYTTCPKCAKAFGENYVVGLAAIEPIADGDMK